MNISESNLRRIVRREISSLIRESNDGYFTDPLTEVEEEALRTAIDIVDSMGGAKGGNIIFPWMIAGMLGISEKAAERALVRLSKLRSAYGGKRIAYDFSREGDIIFSARKA